MEPLAEKRLDLKKDGDGSRLEFRRGTRFAYSFSEQSIQICIRQGIHGKDVFSRQWKRRNHVQFPAKIDIAFERAAAFVGNRATSLRRHLRVQAAFVVCRLYFAAAAAIRDRPKSGPNGRGHETQD